MPSNHLKPIKVPAATRWREIRLRLVPLIVFSCIAFISYRLWQQLPISTGIRGIGEAQVFMLSSPQNGFLRQGPNERSLWAKSGTAIASIFPFDPRSQLDRFQLEVEISRLSIEPSLADRLTVSYEELRIHAMRLNQAMAMAKANLDRAQKVLPRHKALLKERLISQDLYDQSVRDQEFYQAEVSETSKSIKEVEGRLAELKPIAQSESPGTNPTMARLIPALEGRLKALETNWAPITLVAPITGEVTMLRRSGDFIRLGEPILTVVAPKAYRIVGYLRQPLPFQPKVGMSMEVTTRMRPPVRFSAKISEIGAAVEIITNGLAMTPQPPNRFDLGLPIMLPIPGTVEIRAGEIVDISKAKGDE